MAQIVSTVNPKFPGIADFDTYVTSVTAEHDAYLAAKKYDQAREAYAHLVELGAKNVRPVPAPAPPTPPAS